MKNLLFIFAFLFSFVSYSQVTASQPTNIELCDENNDGFEEFDLTVKITEILNGQNPSQFEVTFFETEVAAQSNTEQITNPNSYVNSSQTIQTIFARLTDTITSDFDITTFSIIVNPIYLVSPVTDFYTCDDTESGDDTDGLAVFDLSLIVEELITLNGSNWDFGVRFYTSQSDAETDINTIADITNYINSTPNEEIYFRVEGNSTSCLSYGSFFINVIACANTDEDGVSDSDEDLNSNGNLADDDTDSDGIPNYMDNDDDNDGVLTINEDYNLNGDPTDDDTDNSGIADYLEASVALSVISFNQDLFKIFPNPTNDKLFIRGLSNPTKISIYNVLGKLVLSEITTNEIDLEGLQSGIYIVKIIDQQKETTRKFIKN